MLSRITIWGMGVLCMFVSCSDKGCHATQYNEILAANAYNTARYQSELYRLIKESNQVDYYYELNEEIMGQQFLVVNAYGDAFCGKLCLILPATATAKKSLSSLQKNNGAQLIGLKFNEHTTEYGRMLVYESLEYIID